MAKKPWFQW